MRTSKESLVAAIRRIRLLVILILACCSAVTFFCVADGGQAGDKVIDRGKELTEWLQSKGGYLNDKVVFQTFEYSDTTMYGMFASENIDKDDVLFEIPHACLLMPTKGHVGDRVVVEDIDEDAYGYISAVYKKDKDKKKEDRTGDKKDKDEFDDDDDLDDDIISDGYTYDIIYDEEYDLNDEHNVPRPYFEFEVLPTNCATVRTLIEEMALGQASEYGAYVNYLKSIQSGQLPSAWSSEAQTLLQQIQGNGDNHEEAKMPPQPPFTGWLDYEWMNVCRGDKSEIQAAALVNQRSWDEVLIPFFDMLSHRNGRYLNTYSDPIRSGKSVVVKASRNILKGEEIYNTYNHCTDCAIRKEKYGTPELLRDYGFTEQYPQRWVFPFRGYPNINPTHVVSFDLDDNKDILSKDTEPGEPELTWNKEPYFGALPWFENQLHRLEKVGEKEGLITSSSSENKNKKRERPQQHKSIPEPEWDTIVSYYAALTKAISKAIDAMNEYANNKKEEGGGAVDEL